MSQPLPRTGLIGDFDICEKDIIQALNQNFDLLDLIVQLRVLGIVSELPADPLEGDAYVSIPDANVIAIWNGSEWTPFEPQLGYVLFNLGDNAIYYFNGVNWVQYKPSYTASEIANVPSGDLFATDVQGALNELQGDIDTIETNISNIETDISTLQTDLDAAEVDIDNLETDVSTLTSNVAALNPSDAVITGLEIDWEKSTQYLSITADTTFTFLNNFNGVTTTAIIINVTGSDLDITLPAGIYKDPNFTFTVKAGLRNTYTFLQSNAQVYAACVFDMDV